MGKFPHVRHRPQGAPSSKPRPRGSLKEATADLFDAAGGITAALALPGMRIKSKTTAFKYSNDEADCADHFAAVDVIAVLEKHADAPFVTRWLADNAGFLLVAKPEPAALPDNWAGRLGMLAKEAGEVIARLGEAYAEGATITAEESARMELRREIREAMEILAACDLALERLEEEAAANG